MRQAPIEQADADRYSQLYYCMRKQGICHRSVTKDRIGHIFLSRIKELEFRLNIRDPVLMLGEQTGGVSQPFMAFAACRNVTFIQLAACSSPVDWPLDLGVFGLFKMICQDE
jgi:hypothetical protein